MLIVHANEFVDAVQTFQREIDSEAIEVLWMQVNHKIRYQVAHNTFLAITWNCFVGLITTTFCIQLYVLQIATIVCK